MVQVTALSQVGHMYEHVWNVNGVYTEKGTRYAWNDFGVCTKRVSTFHGVFMEYALHT